MIRAVLDTNIVISGLFWGGLPEQIFFAARDERFVALLTEPVLNELAMTLTRPKFAKQFIRRKLNLSYVIEEYRSMALFVDPVDVPHNSVRDPKDRMILACAVGGRADTIVSGDKDLLVLGHYESIPIVSADQFLHDLAI